MYAGLSHPGWHRLIPLGPFELAKNVVQTSVLVAHRSQASPDAVRDPNLHKMPRLGTLEAFKQIINRHGFRGLYTGYHLHAMRDTIGTGLYFGIYETIKQVIAKELGPQQSPFGPPVIAGAFCGTIPWILVGEFGSCNRRRF
jgi:Mitochondrial carrier protein